MNNGPGGMTHIIFHDGLCGLCHRLNRFVLKHDRNVKFGFAPLQSPFAHGILERYGKDPENLETFYLLADRGTASARLLQKGLAALEVLRALGWPWRIACISRILPSSLLDFGYDLVARNRYRLFGKFETCPLPVSEHRERFFDW